MGLSFFSSRGTPFLVVSTENQEDTHPILGVQIPKTDTSPWDLQPGSRSEQVRLEHVADGLRRHRSLSYVSGSSFRFFPFGFRFETNPHKGPPKENTSNLAQK